MKRIIRLTESDLHQIVKESVNRVLNEANFWSGLRRAWNTSNSDQGGRGDAFLWYLVPNYTGKITRSNYKYGVDRDRERTKWDGSPMGLSGYDTKKDREIYARETEISNFMGDYRYFKKNLIYFINNGEYIDNGIRTRALPHYLRPYLVRILRNAEKVGFEDKAMEIQNLVDKAIQVGGFNSVDELFSGE